MLYPKIVKNFVGCLQIITNSWLAVWRVWQELSGNSVDMPLNVKIMSLTADLTCLFFAKP